MASASDHCFEVTLAPAVEPFFLTVFSSTTVILRVPALTTWSDSTVSIFSFHSPEPVFYRLSALEEKAEDRINCGSLATACPRQIPNFDNCGRPTTLIQVVPVRIIVHDKDSQASESMM